MANLLYFIAAVLILSALVCLSTEDYPCRLDKPRKSDLDKRMESVLVLSPEQFREVLVKTDKQNTYRGIPVADLLAMEEVTDDKCNLAEFEKRGYYSALQRFNSLSHATVFIENQFNKLRSVCNVENGRVHREAKAATDDDRSIIQKVVSAGKLKSKTVLTNKKVSAATDKYLKSEPGTKEFVRDARRLRILDACGHVQYIKKLVWGTQTCSYADRDLFDDTNMFQMYRENEHKRRNKVFAKGSNKLFAAYGKAPKSIQKAARMLGFLMFLPAWISLFVTFTIQSKTSRALIDSKYEIIKIDPQSEQAYRAWMERRAAQAKAGQ